MREVPGLVDDLLRVAVAHAVVGFVFGSIQIRSM
jgi:hypothetical protein